MYRFASSTAFAASLQDEVLNEVNLERTAAGIQPLSGIVYLDQAAGTRAQEAGILFAHQRPDGSPVKSVLNGASCSWFGENLAISSVVDAKRSFALGWVPRRIAQISLTIISRRWVYLV